MRKLYTLSYYTLSSLVLLSALLAGSGCVEHRHRVYDPYYSDYHRWTPDEDRRYHDWYVQIFPGRGYRDYRHLESRDQERYWRYRHGEGAR
jgi:hypothetical protein